MRSLARLSWLGAAALLVITVAACSSSKNGSASSTLSAGGAGATVSGSASGVPTLSASGMPSLSGSASATLTGGHCSLYPRSQVMTLIGTPNVTTGLPKVTASGGTQVDTCMFGHIDVMKRSAKMVSYGAVKYSSNAAAAAAVHVALNKAESEASGPAREFPAPGLPAGTRDGTWHWTGMSGLPSVTMAAVVSNAGSYLVWADGGGTVSAAQAEQIALTVAKQLVSRAGG